MKSRTLLIAAVCIGGIAVMVTIYPRFILGRPASRTTKSVTVTRRATDADILAFNKAMTDPKTILLTKQKTAFSCQTTGMDISSEGGWVEVAVASGLFDRSEGYRYRWCLNVYEAESKLRVVHRNYDEQIFSVPDHEAQPKFLERIPLQPGDYRVEVVLHRTPADFDLSQLEDVEVDRSHRVVSIHKPITVAPFIE